MSGLRDSRTDATYFDEMVGHLSSNIEIDEERLLRPVDQWRKPDSLAMAAGDAMKSRWARFSSLYSSGASPDQLREDFDGVLGAAERAAKLEKELFAPSLVQLQFRNPKIKDYYREWLWLVALALAFEVDDATFDRVVAAVEFGWGDKLIDRLITARRPSHAVGAELLFPRVVGLLDDAMAVEDSTAAAKCVARYLPKWYQGWKGTGGWGTHESVPKKLYWGYWAFETLGVVASLELDDSSFRDNEYYPKDLAPVSRDSRPS